MILEKPCKNALVKVVWHDYVSWECPCHGMIGRKRDVCLTEILKDVQPQPRKWFALVS